MANFMTAPVAFTVPKKKLKLVRVQRYVRASTTIKARASKAVQAELAVRASTSGDIDGMVRVDGAMTRAQALAAVMGISLEDAALL